MSALLLYLAWLAAVLVTLIVLFIGSAIVAGMVDVFRDRKRDQS